MFTKHTSLLVSIPKTRFLAVIFTFFFLINSIAQNTNNEQIKRVQRAIYIFNFTQQVSWENLNNLESFTIGVLGNDRTIIDLKSLASKRKIYNKPVQVVSYLAAKDIENIQVLYVNQKFHYDIDYVLNKIANKNILIITEDYKYNTSMINMVNVGNSFEYEMNTDLITKEGFLIAPSLKENAISSAEKWKLLFQNTEEALEKVIVVTNEQQEQIANKDSEINKQETLIDKQKIAIDTIKTNLNKQTNWIDKLAKNNLQKDQKLEDKVLIQQQLEQLILAQLDSIKEQNLVINNSQQKIDIQEDFLSIQNQDIASKKEILKKNDTLIYKLKTFNYLLIGLILISLLTSYILYRNYKTKKKHNKILKEKNAIIYKQSKQLTSKNKELEQFAYITSHDLKEPLNTISGLISLLLEDYEDKLDEEGKMSLNFINESSLRMKTLIDSLLRYSRLGKSKEIEKINTTNLLEELKADLGSIISKTNAKISYKNLPVLFGTKVEIRLLFQNLISNAIKFVSNDVTPNIEISCIKDTSDALQEYWQFAIKDNGIGIAENYQDRIFAIFQRLHTREEYEGTGIGLAHCKKIVESHGGTIWLESEVGKGTTFFFTIPVN